MNQKEKILEIPVEIKGIVSKKELKAILGNLEEIEGLSSNPRRFSPFHS